MTVRRRYISLLLPNGPLHRTPPRLARLAVALLAGCVFWFILAHDLSGVGQSVAAAGDFTLHWWAGNALRSGHSPYAVINAVSKAYPYCSGYLYWLPTAVMLSPFTLVSLFTAMPLFTGLSVAIFTFAITRDGYWRLPFLLSAPAVYAILGGQVVLLVVAAMLIPSLAWLAPMKYTMGFAGLASTLSRRYAVLFALPVLASIAVWPFWPLAWFRELHDVAGRYYHVPVLVTGGFLLPLAALRWRLPEARLLLVMAFAPQTMFNYDQLPLLLVARGRTQAIVFALVTYLPRWLNDRMYGPSTVDREALFSHLAPLIVACYYLPCLAIVLSRPNAGAVPSWLDRVMERSPRWLRGESVGGRSTPARAIL